MTKDQVLTYLLNSNDYVSGEAISKHIGVSRAAVNQAVRVLRDDGYVISSTTNKGYKLESSPDRLSLGAIMAHLPDIRRDDIIILPTIDSTNTYLKKLAAEGAKEGTVVISDEQTKGRGRRGKSFDSPKGKGIYLSILFRPNVSPEVLSQITAWTAVAISNAIKKSFNIDTQIKWVNDLLINNRKICGILTELSLETESGSIDNVVIGMGINVNESESDFPSELNNIATSISMENNNQVFDRSKLAGILISELDQMLADFPANASKYVDAYRRDCITTGKDVCIISADGTQKDGYALSVDDDFSLKIEYKDGSISNVKSGEVSVRGLYGYT